MKGPFCIVSDDEGHHYVIQSKRQAQWEAFLKSEDCQLGKLPQWCHQIDSPERIDFIDYTVRHQ